MTPDDAAPAIVSESSPSMRFNVNLQLTSRNQPFAGLPLPTVLPTAHIFVTSTGPPHDPSLHMQLGHSWQERRRTVEIAPLLRSATCGDAKALTAAHRCGPISIGPDGRHHAMTPRERQANAQRRKTGQDKGTRPGLSAILSSDKKASCPIKTRAIKRHLSLPANSTMI